MMLLCEPARKSTPLKSAEVHRHTVWCRRPVPYDVGITLYRQAVGPIGLLLSEMTLPLRRPFPNRVAVSSDQHASLRIGYGLRTRGVGANQIALKDIA